jgi:gluconolactonase
MRQLTSGLNFPEGPVALADGSLLVGEIATGTIARVAADGALTRVANCRGGVNGMAIGPDSSVYVCNNGGLRFEDRGDHISPVALADDSIGGRIQRVDVDAGSVTDVYAEFDGTALVAPNDLVFDDHGCFYFTDSASGCLYYAAADGSGIARVASEITFPNGVGLSPDGAHVYVAETYSGRLWRFTLAKAGIVAEGGRRELCQLDGAQFDSLAIDSDGNVCVATLSANGVTAISPDGQVVAEVKVPVKDPFVTNVCFGGEDLRTAYITSSGTGRVFVTEWHCPGLPTAYSR